MCERIGGRGGRSLFIPKICCFWLCPLVIVSQTGFLLVLQFSSKMSASCKHADDISVERAWPGVPLLAQVPFTFKEAVQTGFIDAVWNTFITAGIQGNIAIHWHYCCSSTTPPTPNLLPSHTRSQPFTQHKAYTVCYKRELQIIMKED